MNLVMAEDEKEKLLQVQSPWIFTLKGEDVKEIYFRSIVPAVTWGSQWDDGFYGYRLKFWPISG